VGDALACFRFLHTAQRLPITFRFGATFQPWLTVRGLFVIGKDRLTHVKINVNQF
jgi:hypothetical protein